MATTGPGRLRGLSRRGRAVRLGAAAAVLAAVVYGSAWGTDDDLPFGPMVQFAFSVDLDGQIRSTYMEADTTAGTRVQVPLSPQGVGIGRAEVEGQLTKILDRPSLLQAFAVVQRRLHPDQPQYERIYLRVEVTQLDHGVAGSRHVEDLATWDVR